MTNPKEFFADRVDCSHTERPVILSGELVTAGNNAFLVRRLRCSYQRQCSSSVCDYLDAPREASWTETVGSVLCEPCC